MPSDLTMSTCTIMRINAQDLIVPTNAQQYLIQCLANALNLCTTMPSAVYLLDKTLITCEGKEFIGDGFVNVNNYPYI